MSEYGISPEEVVYGRSSKIGPTRRAMGTIISFGGGVQSTAMMVLAAEGRLGFDVDAVVFANTGTDSENAATLDYIECVAIPYMAEHGLHFVEVDAGQWPNGSPRTLLSQLDAYNGCQGCGATPEDDCYQSCTATRNTGGDMPIPLKIEPLGVPVSRSCTNHWKILPVRNWLIANGASGTNPATVLIGISTDELHRATSKPRHPAEVAAYPLLDLGISRNDCRRIILDAGLSVPPKSHCWFCPFKSESQWAEARRDEPQVFAAAVGIEQRINVQRKRRNLSDLRFVAGKPLDEVREAQTPLFTDSAPDGGACDEGYCWT